MKRTRYSSSLTEKRETQSGEKSCSHKVMKLGSNIQVVYTGFRTSHWGADVVDLYIWSLSLASLWDSSSFGQEQAKIAISGEDEDKLRFSLFRLCTSLKKRLEHWMCMCTCSAEATLAPTDPVWPWGSSRFRSSLDRMHTPTLKQYF